MPPMTIRVPGKINLSLDVVGRRPDGYHLLSTVMQAVDIFDDVVLEPGTGGQEITITSDRTDLVVDERNTCHRAAADFFKEAGITDNLHIHIRKRIPQAAGMGGGSADAAGVLYGLDLLYPGRLSSEALHALGTAIGADVPFCLMGGTALCEGIGEYITPLPPFADVPAIIVKPSFGVSTAWVFSHLDRENLGVRPDTSRLIQAMALPDLHQMAGAAGNVLESVTASAYPLLPQIKRWLIEGGAGMAAMSGSGPTVFGLFADETRRDLAARLFSEKYSQAGEVFCSRTITGGPRVVS